MPRKRPASAPRTVVGTRTLWLIAVGVVVVIAIAIGLLVWPSGSALADPPGQGTTVVASDLSKAAEAAEAEAAGTTPQRAALYLSEQPTAVWITPENTSLEQVPDRITHLLEEAREQSATLAIVVYGLPGRDCGNHSAGGLDPVAYTEWTTEIGAALQETADVPTIIVLEPDSLALATECGNVRERAAQLRGAVEALAADHTWIYLDGGHSNWLPVNEMAALIERVGVPDLVRGFATNVSNYNDTDDEVRYAHALSQRLDGEHALIDTSRNGAGSNGEWCNPSARRVGDPGGELGDEVVDTNLWIKPPGESDGPCNGGPAAGLWWPQAAVTLTRSIHTR